jgi:hypothetical protein
MRKRNIIVILDSPEESRKRAVPLNYTSDDLEIISVVKNTPIDSSKDVIYIGSSSNSSQLKPIPTPRQASRELLIPFKRPKNLPILPPSPPGAIVKCSICLESATKESELVVAKCGHIFCKACLEQSLQVKRECPNCRKNIPKKNGFQRFFL